ncbi:hypothetical protein WN943_010456 [Citrus x changshan-huyou]
MEKQNNFVVNGGLKLPIGYRFRPTDEELVVHYLKRKVFGLPLPASIIPELDVFQSHPLGLPGDMKEKKRYFFSNIRNESAIANDGKCKIAAGSGYWKPVGKNRQILASGTKQVVGIRKTLIFCEGKRGHETKTQWVMHQYHLVAIATNTNLTQPVFKMVIIGDWVVYRIFQRKKKPKKRGVVSSNNLNITKNSHKNQLQVIDFSVIEADQTDLLGPPPQAASSCSSEITADELSPSVLDQEETSA